MYNDGLSASDVALLSGNTGNNNGFGDNNGWWIIIFLIFALGGWGNRGFGGFGGGSGAADNYVLASDFATLQRQIDSVGATLERKADATQQGLCDGFYAMNAGMLNGFAGVQNALCQGFNGLNTNVMQGNYALTSQLANCCCDIEKAIADCCCTTNRNIDSVNYNMATNTCAITNAITLNTRDIIESNNANYRALHDEIVANRIEDKNAQIVAQQNEINALRLKASQEAQNNYLISQLGEKYPVPAFVVQPPQQVTFPTNCCGGFTGFNTGYNNCGGCGNY